MKSRIIAPLLALSFSSYASADKLPNNLIKFTTTDICPSPSASLYIDGKKDEGLSAKMTQAMADQDLLFGSKFFTQGNKCSLFIGFNVEAMSLNNKGGTAIGYVYTYRLSVFTLSANIALDSRVFAVSVPTIYDISSFGASGNRAELDSVALSSSKEVFQDFLLDWRKTH